MSDLINSASDAQAQFLAKREVSLVPANSIGGRALVIVIAIMTFMVSLTGGGATLVAEASRNWRDSVSKEVTVQIKPRLGEDTDALVKIVVAVASHTPGVAFVHALSRTESERTLEPWLGQGLNLSQLPIPRIIVLTQASLPIDQQALRETLASITPEASLDDHQLWVSRLNALAYIVVTFAAGVLCLMIVAMSIAIGFATRGAMSGNNEIIAVLHFVGAADAFIAKQFQTHFTRLGSRGAAMGGSAAALVFLLPAFIPYAPANFVQLGSITALFGDFKLSILGYLFIATICLAMAALTGLISRTIVLNHLQRLF
jgi:cell division transport system permease protein